MTEPIGFIGLGIMGAPMAGHVGSRYELVVYDTDPSRFDRVEASRLARAGSVGEVGRRCRLVLLSLPGSEVVTEVIAGPEGLAANMAEGGVVIDTSTTEPHVTQKLAGELEQKGISLLDAPVSGGEGGARSGSLSIMVGGEQAVFDACLPVLQTMGQSVIRVGDIGMGQVAKLVNNLIVGITFAAVAEGLSLGTKAGLNADTLYQAIRGGWASSKVLDVSAKAILNRDFRPGGTVDIHWKDLSYALSLARSQDVPVPMTALTHEIFKAARASGRGKLAQPAIIQLWESLLGIEVKSV
jgi:2-hydroxy-3-oxopropionate reductase